MGVFVGEGVVGGEGEDQEGAGEGDLLADAVEGFAAEGGEFAEGVAFEPVGLGEGLEVFGELAGVLGGEEEAGVGEGFAEAFEAAADLADSAVMEGGEFGDGQAAVEVGGEEGAVEGGEVAGLFEEELVIGAAGFAVGDAEGGVGCGWERGGGHGGSL